MEKFDRELALSLALDYEQGDTVARPVLLDYLRDCEVAVFFHKAWEQQHWEELRSFSGDVFRRYLRSDFHLEGFAPDCDFDLSSPFALVECWLPGKSSWGTARTVYVTTWADGKITAVAGVLLTQNFQAAQAAQGKTETVAVSTEHD